MSIHSTLDISLQGREYRVTCAPEERESLLAAVAFVNAKMTEIAALTKSTGERLAVMTALNLAHELLVKPGRGTTSSAGSDAASSTFDSGDFSRRIDSMVARLDAAMTDQVNLFL